MLRKQIVLHYACVVVKRNDNPLLSSDFGDRLPLTRQQVSVYVVSSLWRGAYSI